ncbi:MAG: CorA family divalent cation transporter [Oscillospiraceae bacterium]
MNKIFSLSEVRELAPYIEEVILDRIEAQQVERFESLGNACLLSFDWYDIFDQKADPSQIIIYFSKENIFFICEEKRLLKKVQTIVKEFTTNEKVLSSFFAELMKPDMDYLEKLEEQIAEMENNLLINSKAECTQGIILFRKELIRLKKYYEQLNSIFEDITENENNLITQENLRHFVVLDNRVDRLFSTVLNLRDFVSQVREAYQAQIDIEQNSVMKVFTVITSIFMPLTLIVGWYGMNLKMPEFSWNLGYPFVIGLSIIVCIICIIIFKKKKWF